MVSIVSSLANESLQDILDEEEVPVPIGSPGVLWAGGKGVFTGYVNLPHLTDAKRKPDIYSGEGWVIIRPIP